MFVGPVVFAVLMFTMQVGMLFAPYPPTPAAVATSALVAYVAFATVAGWIDRRRVLTSRD